MFVRFFEERPVVFGIGPGKDGTIKRLYKNGLIEAPLLSIAMNSNRIVFGAEANDYCENDWHYYPTLSKNSWAIEVDIIRITSLKDLKNVKVGFDQI